MIFMLERRGALGWVQGIVVLGVGVLLLPGCAHLKEGGRRLWGSSISHLEKARDGVNVLEVTMALDAVFAKVGEILIESDAQVYMRAEDMAYLTALGFSGHVDTTQVGVFFEERTKQTIRIEVASMSPSLADKVARLLSEKLGTSRVSSPGGENK